MIPDQNNDTPGGNWADTIRSNNSMNMSASPEGAPGGAGYPQRPLGSPIAAPFVNVPGEKTQARPAHPCPNPNAIGKPSETCPGVNIGDNTTGHATPFESLIDRVQTVTREYNAY